jgi:protein-tyrosine phosphatase
LTLIRLNPQKVYLASETVLWDNVPILIHCHAGVSRSASVVIHYVASTFQISANEAIERVRQSRSIIEPNEGFMAKLQELYPPI